MDIGNVGDGRSGAKGEETCEVKDILKVPPKPLEYTPLIMNEILNPPYPSQLSSYWYIKTLSLGLPPPQLEAIKYYLSSLCLF